MALIIKCKSCGKRIIPQNGRCPDCEKADYEFTLDYRVDGRFSKRIRMHLPDKITSKEVFNTGFNIAESSENNLYNTQNFLKGAP